ncbi:glutamine--tRNA ligase/YqeY domain fusion protein [Succinispira mobilis]|uniref:glutamine--tRNA ligase/YqeY domain fusion protein n=1 Tax=Succinispira mobilis TaxID=78120 RepID=UPI00036A49C0|nr:glutamine--tRNA ligase/YqeY domain fusion protein [Succinispira mobilis]
MEKFNENSNFIKAIMKEDLESGKHQEIITRFPPEPNGYLHIGHAKAVLTNYLLAKEFNGKMNLRFDDTNPIKEEEEFVQGIIDDIKWLGVEYSQLLFASDTFEQMYNHALDLIKKGKAYVDDQSQEQMRETRGTLTTPGIESPYRNRSVEENLQLFEEMRQGLHPAGSRVLRAKIDMASPNMNLRDPAIYRILNTKHFNTGDKWFVYPMYDYAHPLEDAFEGVTHSLCSLEYEDHRPLYDWVIENCETPAKPRQIEFARLNMTNTVMSKRYLKQLVDEKYVEGWDDPRMPTIAGLRRRGYTPEAIINFVQEVGLSKAYSIVDGQMLEHFIREDLKLKAPRTMAVLKPLKVVITNYPEGQVEYLDAEINPEVPEMGTKKIPFSREIYIEQDDFMENPIPKYFRLFPGNEVRLKHAYFIKCNDFIKDEQGNVVEIHATYDPETKSGSGFTGRKVKGTIHWIDATKNIPADFHLYEPLLRDNAENEDTPFLERLNPNSEEIVQGFVEEDLATCQGQDKFQFFRHGYFNVDPKRSVNGKLSFNRIVSLKSSFKF